MRLVVVFCFLVFDLEKTARDGMKQRRKRSGRRNRGEGCDVITAFGGGKGWVGGEGRLPCLL